MKKILICSFSCQPGKGSEPGVGWNWAIQAAKTQDVYVLTRTKMKEYLEPNIPSELKDTLHFLYAPSSKKMRKISIYLEYLLWQKTAYKYAKALVKENHFDYVWHLTWGNMFLPTYMYKLKIPFIWGPVGGDGVPTQFIKCFSKKKQIIHKVKAFLGKNAEKMLWIKKMADNSTIIIARTEETKKLFSKKNQEKTIVRLEACVDMDSTFSYAKETKLLIEKQDGFDLGYTGRLVDFKNVLMLIKCMEKISKQYPNVKLHILGDGEDLEKAKKISKELGIENRIIFYGFVERSEMLKALKQIDLFCFPSLREGASWSLLEAMAFEIPIIAFNLNGIGSTLKDSGAMLIDIDGMSPEKSEELFYEQMVKALQMKKEELNEIGKKEKNSLIQKYSAEGVSKFIKEIIE